MRIDSNHSSRVRPNEINLIGSDADPTPVTLILSVVDSDGVPVIMCEIFKTVNPSRSFFGFKRETIDNAIFFHGIATVFMDFLSSHFQHVMTTPPHSREIVASRPPYMRLVFTALTETRPDGEQDTRRAYLDF